MSVVSCTLLALFAKLVSELLCHFGFCDAIAMSSSQIDSSAVAPQAAPALAGSPRG